MQVQFYGYTFFTDTLGKAQMILAQAKLEKDSGDIDKWFYAGCPIGKAYKKWEIKEKEEKSK